MEKRGIVLLLVCVCIMCQPLLALTEEIPFGGEKEFTIGTETWRVLFEKKQDRVCFVNLQKMKKQEIVFSKPLTFDSVREERYEHINDTTLTIFYVEKGVIVLVDGREI